MVVEASLIGSSDGLMRRDWRKVVVVVEAAVVELVESVGVGRDQREEVVKVVVVGSFIAGRGRRKREKRERREEREGERP